MAANLVIDYQLLHDVAAKLTELKDQLDVKPPVVSFSGHDEIGPASRSAIEFLQHWDSPFGHAKKPLETLATLFNAVANQFFEADAAILAGIDTGAVMSAVASFPAEQAAYRTQLADYNAQTAALAKARTENPDDPHAGLLVEYPDGKHPVYKEQGPAPVNPGGANPTAHLTDVTSHIAADGKLTFDSTYTPLTNGTDHTFTHGDTTVSVHTVAGGTETRPVPFYQAGPDGTVVQNGYLHNADHSVRTAEFTKIAGESTTVSGGGLTYGEHTTFGEHGSYTQHVDHATGKAEDTVVTLSEGGGGTMVRTVESDSKKVTSHYTRAWGGADKGWEWVCTDPDPEDKLGGPYRLGGGTRQPLLG